MGLRNHDAGRWALVVFGVVVFKRYFVAGGGCMWTDI